MKFTFFLFSLLLLPGAYAQPHLHRINPNWSQPSLEKKGYYLLMNEEFEGRLNVQRWDKAGIGDENEGCTLNYRQLEEQVSLVDGQLKIVFQAKERAGCDYVGGEIKTFEFVDGSPYRNWWLFPGSYLEIRTKVPLGQGVATAGWLYGNKVNEIDMWEFWDKHKDRYQINYHWGEDYPSGDYDHDPYEVAIQDLEGRAVMLDEHYLTFGLEWDTSYIRHYLNGQLIKEYDLTARPPSSASRPYPHTVPSCLRFTGGVAMRCPGMYLEEGNQKEFFIDYIRYYRKSGYRALPELSIPDTIQWHSYGGGENLSVAYHPDARYSWYSPAFKMEPNSTKDCMCEKVWLSFGPDLEAGRSYPVIMSVSFPSGHREIRRWEVYVKK